MFCPQCGQRNDLGSQRCRYCQRLFTREPGASKSVRPATPVDAWSDARAAASQGFDPRPPERRRPSEWETGLAWDDAATAAMPESAAGMASAPARPVAPADPRAGTGRTQARGRKRGSRSGKGNGRRRSRRAGCLLAFGVTSLLVVGGLVMLLLAASMIIEPMVRDGAVADIGESVRVEVARQISAQISGADSGEVVISEADINERLAGDMDLGPISDARVQITPEGLVVRMNAYGVDGTYRAQVTDNDGVVAIQGSPMEGPLAYVMPEGDLERAVNDALASAISEAGYYVEQVAVVDGAITLTLAQ